MLVFYQEVLQMVRKLSKFFKIEQKLFFLSVNLIPAHTPFQNKESFAKPFLKKQNFYEINIFIAKGFQPQDKTYRERLISEYDIIWYVTNVLQTFEKS